MKRIMRFTTLFAVLMLLTVGSARGADLSGQLIVSGSDTLEPLMIDLAKKFMESYKGIKIVVRGGGSNKGLAELRNGTASIGMASRTLTSQESAEFKMYTIAYDGVCFVTSKKNPVQSLNQQQITGIFTGKTTNWKAVGGNDLPISPVIRDRQSSTNKVVADYLGLRDTDLRGSVINDAEIGVSQISRDPKGIFIVSTAEAFHDKLLGLQINILSVDGKKPTQRGIAQGSYPITRPLNLVTKGDPSPVAKAFISYCQTAVATPFIRSNNFVSPQ